MLLNTFPALLSFQTLSPLILRVVVGFVAINLGYLKLTKERGDWKDLFETIQFHPADAFVNLLALIELVGGVLLILGAFTQITALVFAVAFFCEAVLEYREEDLERRNLAFYILMFAVCLSLIFSGAGAFALDLPL